MSKDIPKRPYVVGPKGEKKPHSVVSNAVHVMRIATGLAKEEYVESKTEETEARKSTSSCK